MGTDRVHVARQGERLRGDGERQPAFCGGGALGGQDGFAVPKGHKWRGLPDEFGHWNSAYKRFARWSGAGVWHGVFAGLCKDADFEEVFIDSTIVRAHQHTHVGTSAAGAPKKKGARRWAAHGAA